MGQAAPKPNDYDRIEDAIRFLADHRADQPELRDVASHVGLSEFHFQRLFTHWAGISPKKFLQHMTLKDAKQRLKASVSVLEASFDVGLSGPGRLHDLFINSHAVSPGEYKAHGAGMAFRYGFHPSPFGECLAVMSDRGLTGLSFVIDGDREAAVEDQRIGWENAEWIEEPQAGTEAVAATFGAFAGQTPASAPLSVLMRGTPYQVRVWEALMRIPPGCITTYGEMADRIGCGRQGARSRRCLRVQPHRRPDPLSSCHPRHRRHHRVSVGVGEETGHPDPGSGVGAGDPCRRIGSTLLRAMLGIAYEEAKDDGQHVCGDEG